MPQAARQRGQLHGQGLEVVLDMLGAVVGLAERLNQAMELSGMSQGALAKASGVAQPTIWRLTSGNARGSTKIVEIANALGVRSEWLSTGIGPMRDDGQMPAISQPKTEPGPTDTFRIEALDFYVSAGPGAINSEFVEVLRSVEYSVEDARRMFNGRKAERDPSSMFAVTACPGPLSQATYSSSISVFSTLMAMGFTPSSTTIHHTLNACKR